MFRLGLCSVTFRDKSVEEVIGIAAANSLDGIEWGGDVHVPPDTPPQRVREIAGLCSDAGIDIPTYGSYFNVLDDSAGDFAPLLETAHALGAGAIRVWAGWVEPGQETAEQWEKITSTSREIAGAAAEKNIRVAYEFHDHTPTEGGENAMRLLEAVGHANMFTYWQTVYPNTLEGSLDN
ncbi:MAG: TIM barrel protein, partial [Gemmatimonadota bacterium]|nr:TIM barrel protein [Gemmatimonadota bacterium]